MCVCERDYIYVRLLLFCGFNVLLLMETGTVMRAEKQKYESTQMYIYLKI